MKHRSRAREVALQVLYGDDLNPGVEPELLEAFLGVRLKSDELVDFARSLLNGVRRNRSEIDALLERIADNWSLTRMAIIDRNVLRLGAYEMLYTSTPRRVVINEAVELAKKFSTAQAPGFVNGILDAIRKNITENTS